MTVPNTTRRRINPPAAPEEESAREIEARRVTAGFDRLTAAIEEFSGAMIIFAKTIPDAVSAAARCRLANQATRDADPLDAAVTRFHAGLLDFGKTLDAAVTAIQPHLTSQPTAVPER